MELDKDYINKSTRYAKIRLEQLAKMLKGTENDEEAIERLRAQECRACYYLGKGQMVGHAFTSFECASCKQTALHHNTNVTKFCRRCSVEKECCCRCGADINYITR